MNKKAGDAGFFVDGNKILHDSVHSYEHEGDVMSEVYKSVPIEALNPLNIPRRGSTNAAAVDLIADMDVEVPPGGVAAVRTGIKVALPEGTAMLILPRSGLAKNKGITVANAPGLIDSDYRGEIVVLLHNRSDQSFFVQRGDRIAQAMIVPFIVPNWDVVAPGGLDTTERGEGGFGSTGV